MKDKSLINNKIYILLILIILLLASTYAWFTINKNVRIDTINVKVATSGHLEISVDAVNWKTMINAEDLLKGVKNNYPNAVNQIPEQNIYPVSTAGNINNGRLDMFFGQVIANSETREYNLITKKEIEKHGEEGKYIAFDIFFRIGHDTTLYLNSASVIQSTDLKNNQTSTGIENAVRIAILNQGTGVEPSQARNLKGSTTATIIEPNYDVHTTTGIEKAQILYGISGLRTNGNAPLQYYGVKTEISEGVQLNSRNSTYFSVVDPAIKLEKNFFGSETKRELLQLKKGITKLRIYMWVEGQDVDCEDNASGANLNFDIQFST